MATRIPSSKLILTKDDSTAWTNGGATSSQTILSGDGYCEYTIPSGGDEHNLLMFGLSNGNTDQNYTDVDFAIYHYYITGKILFYENGNYEGQTAFNGVPGDVLRVAVEGTAVKMYCNGTLIYTNAAPATPPITYPLLVDVAIYGQYDTVLNANINGEPISWTNMVGTSYSEVHRPASTRSPVGERSPVTTRVAI